VKRAMTAWYIRSADVGWSGISVALGRWTLASSGKPINRRSIISSSATRTETILIIEPNLHPLAETILIIEPNLQPLRSRPFKKSNQILFFQPKIVARLRISCFFIASRMLISNTERKPL